MIADIRLDIAEQVLQSGLTLLAVRNPAVATYACVASFDVRPGDEGAAQAGLANLMGECLDEGTERHSALELAAAIESLGGTINGNQRGGSVACLAEHRQKAVLLLRDLLLRPTFPGREVRRVQGEIVDEIRTEDDDPRAVAGQRFRREVYGAHPLGRPPKGERATLTRLRPRDLRDFHAAWFRPGGGYLAAVGPFEPQRMLAELHQAFRGFRGKPPAHVPVVDVELPRLSRDVHLPMAREQVHVYLGHIGVRRTHPDYYVLSVMDHVLGTGPGFTSRCARRLRDEQGLCYAVSAGVTPSAGEDQGAFTAYIGTSPEHRQRAVDGFLAEIDRLRREPPSSEELADVQAYLTGSFVFGLERNNNLAAYAIRARRFQLGFDFLHRYPGIIRAISREQVRVAAEQHLHPERMVVVSAGAS